MVSSNSINNVYLKSNCSPSLFDKGKENIFFGMLLLLLFESSSVIIFSKILSIFILLFS